MNDQASSVIPSQILPVQLFAPRRARTWLSRGNNVIERAVKAIPLAQMTVRWEAYAIDTGTDQAIEAYPRLTGTSVVNAQALQTNQEIQQLYMTQVEGTPDLDIAALKANVDSGLWCISTHILTNQPA